MHASIKLYFSLQTWKLVCSMLINRLVSNFFLTRVLHYQSCTDQTNMTDQVMYTSVCTAVVSVSSEFVYLGCYNFCSCIVLVDLNRQWHV